MSVGTPQRRKIWIRPRTARSSEGRPVRSKGARLLQCRQGRVRVGLCSRAPSEGLWRHRKRAFLRWRDKKKRPRSEETVGNYGVELLFSGVWPK